MTCSSEKPGQHYKLRLCFILTLCIPVLQVQSIIGASRAIAFDLTAACSGFVVGLVTAAQFVRGGSYSNVLVIGADALSRYVDWRDRGEPLQHGKPSKNAISAVTCSGWQ